MAKQKNYYEKKYYHPLDQNSDKKTRLKTLIEGMYGEYNIDSIEEISSLLFTDKNEVMRLVEENYENDVESLIELSKWFSVSVDYLLGLTDYPHPYPRNE